VSQKQPELAGASQPVSKPAGRRRKEKSFQKHNKTLKSVTNIDFPF